MRVDLIVSNDRHAAQAQKAWDTFRQAILPLNVAELGPEVRVRVEPNMAMAPRATATAAWVPPGAVMPEYTEFSLSDTFFALDKDGQTTILLHEAVHVRLYRTRLIENYRLIRRWPRFSNATTQFELDRENLAWEVLTFPQEVGVDKFLAGADYPAPLRDRYFRDRAHYYRNGEGHRYDGARSPALAVHRLFYGLLRTELGLLVMPDAAERERLQDLRTQRDEEFQRRIGDELPWFRGVQERLLAISIDTEAPDPDPYRDLSDRVLATPERRA
jgi:hypothetical protein